MEAATFNSFTKRIYLKAPLQKIYSSWATADGICQWFLESADYKTINGEQRDVNSLIEKGDSYTWKWHNWDTKESGEVFQADGKNKLQLSFAGNCLVTVTLQEMGEVVLVSLTQSNIPTDDKHKLNIFMGCSNGWTFWLTNLKAYLEHNILLNEVDIDLRNIPNSDIEFVNI